MTLLVKYTVITSTRRRKTSTSMIAKTNNMKIVDKQFIESLHVAANYRPNPVREEAAKMAIGESLFISKEEWAQMGFKSDQANLLTSGTYQPRAKMFGWRFSIKTAVEGWVITRTK